MNHFACLKDFREILETIGQANIETLNEALSFQKTLFCYYIHLRRAWGHSYHPIGMILILAIKAGSMIMKSIGIRHLPFYYESLDESNL